MAGLPRSGNTLLSAILNQNPEIYVSPLSIVPDLMYGCYKEVADNQHFKISPDIPKFYSAVNGIIHNYYADVEKPIVIDRQKAWANPINLEMLKKHITPRPKILFTVRPTLEIVASFLHLYESENVEVPTIDQDMNKNSYAGFFYKDRIEARCEWLLRPSGQIDTGLLGVANLGKPENRQDGHFIEYDNLIRNPQETMNAIYDFLELSPYNHNFDKIEKINVDNDEAADLSPNTHLVKSRLTRPDYDFTELLPKSILARYGNLDNWKGLV